MGRGPNAGGGRHARGAKQQRSGGRGSGRGGRGAGRGGRGAGRGGRGAGRGGRGSGRGGRGRGGRGGKKGKTPADWTCSSCGVNVFGSKSACFKCGAAKGKGDRAGGSGKDSAGGAAAPAVVDTVNISKADRALIRGLMDEGSAQLPLSSDHSSGATPEGLKDRGGAVSRQLQAELAKMGFAEQDISKADDVCGGLRSIHGALNWLLLHTPEERIPPNLGSLPAPKRKGGRRSGGGGAGPKKKDRSKMSDAQKVTDNLIQIGFEPEDVEYCVQHTRKQTVYPDSLKMLFEWYKIRWNFAIDFDEGIPTSQIKAAATAERKALETKYSKSTGGFFRVLTTRCDAWRLRFPVTEFCIPAGTNVGRWDEEEICTWVSSITRQYNLDPHTVRAVRRFVKNGRELLALTPDIVAAWAGLPQPQVDALLGAVTDLEHQSAGTHLPRQSGPAVTLDLVAHFPKILIPGAKTARKNRYPFETPLLCIAGWGDLEDATGIDVSPESKRAMLKAIGEYAIGLVASSRSKGCAGAMQKIADWTAQHILEIVPELQWILAEVKSLGLDLNASRPNPNNQPHAKKEPKLSKPASVGGVMVDAKPSKTNAVEDQDAPPGLPVPVAMRDIQEQSRIIKQKEQELKLKEKQRAVAERTAVENAAQEERARRTAERRDKRARDGAQVTRDAKLGERMQLAFRAQKQRPAYQKMLRGRQSLPAYQRRTEIVKAIADKQVVIISGATGCGKSTQVPQLLLDSMLEDGLGAKASIVCTQPRRLAAIGVAERVAAERAERCGETVGYSIRLESKRSPSTRLLFCTTGILLRTLEGDGDLLDFADGAGVSHVLVDEVHERNAEIDFLLIILKDLLIRRPNLKLVLMSATLNAGLFADFFREFSTTVLEIPGRTFPVTRMYLEDAIEQTQYKLDPQSDSFRKGGGGGRSGNHGRAGKKATDSSSLGFGESTQQWIDETGTKGLRVALGPKYSSRTIDSIRDMDMTAIDYDLVTALVAHVALHGKNAGVVGGSAILVFLPGLAEITAAIESMRKHPQLRDVGRFRILPLHSQLPTHEQRIVFDVPPHGCTKVVVSTNIAETSVTINDISVVIDAGTHKEMQYDPICGMSCLREVRVSKANAAQRAGRAGRVREGFAYHLFLRRELQEMPAQQLPEMLRCPLESIALRIKTLRKGKIGEFLSKAIEPPSQKAIRHVIDVLRGLSALDTIPSMGKQVSGEDAQHSHGLEELTPLGTLLAQLPVDPRIGKMMLFGAIFRCLESTLVIAASLAFRSPFFSPFDKRAEADKVKKSFAQGQSDHLTLLRAFNSWTRAREEGRSAERAFLQDNFLSRNTLGMIEKMKNQFRQLLRDIGFYHRRDHEVYNENSDNAGLVKAVLVAGLYPNVVKLELPPATKNSGRNTNRNKPKRPPKMKTQKLWDQDAKEENVGLHPSSVLFNETSFSQQFLVFHEKVKTSQIFVRDATAVSPFALLLFGGSVEVAHLKGEVTLDKWLRFAVPAQHAVMICAMRDKLMAIMHRKIDQPKHSLLKDPEATKVIMALAVLVGEAGVPLGRPAVGSAPGLGAQARAGRREGRSGGGGGKNGTDSGRPGDWTCGACGASVFASKVACFKCGASKSGPQQQNVTDKIGNTKHNSRNPTGQQARSQSGRNAHGQTSDRSKARNRRGKGNSRNREAKLLTK